MNPDREVTMNNQVLFFILAGVMLLLLPLVPRMMTLRIRILRFLHLRWLADLHEKYFDGLTIAVRVILVAMAGLFTALGAGWVG